MLVPNGKTNRNLILVETYGEPINTIDKLKEKGEKPFYSDDRWLINKELTEMSVCVFDEKMQLYSDNSVYKNTKGLYIKKGGKRYYLGDFK